MRTMIKSRVPILLAVLPACIGCTEEPKGRPGGGGGPPSRVVSKEEVTVPAAPQVVRDENQNLIKVWGRSAQAMVFSQPRADAPTVRPIRLGSLLYLFQPGPGEGWMLVGADPRGRGEGYARASDAFITSNVQVAWLRRETAPLRAPAELFARPEDIHGRMITGDSEKYPAVFVESEFTGGEADLWANPILEVREIQAGNRKVRIMKIATFTWTARAGAPVAGTTTLAKAITMCRKLDIALFVDSTGSMGWFIDGLKSYLVALVEALRNEKDLDVQVAVWCYRDYDEDSQWLTKPYPLTGDVGAVTRWLTDIRAEQGGDWVEAMFDAVWDGVQKVQWRKGSYRVGIIAANNGSHPENDPQNPRHLTAANVIAAAKRQRVVLCGLQIPRDPRDNSDPTLLPRQLRELAAGTGGTVLEIRDAARADPSELMRHLSKLCSQAGQTVATQVQIVSSLAKGEDAEIVRKRLGLPKAMFARLRQDLNERLGSDPEKLAVGSGLVGFEAGWTVMDPQTWEVGVLMRTEEVRSLIVLLDRLVTIGLEEPQRLVEVFQAVLGQELGEKLSLMDTRLDLELKARGLPLRDESILSLTLSELLALPPPVRRQWTNHVKARYEALVQAERQAPKDEYGNTVIPLSALP